MPRGHRYAIAALVGWLVLSAANQVNQQSKGRTSDRQPATTTRATPSPTPSPSNSPTAKFTSYPGYNPDPCYHAEDHDAADLCAQWRAAISSEKAAAEARRATNWSIIATALSLATIIGLIVTIWQTKGALAEARRGNRLNLLFERRSRRESREAAAEQARALEFARVSAEAAQAQVVIASETARKRLRAYVDFVSIEHIVVNDICGGIKMVIKNFGLTPAINLVINRVITTIGYDLGSPLGLREGIKAGDLSPSDTTVSSIRFRIPADSWQLISLGKASTQIEITLSYEDTFGETYTLHQVVESTRNEPFGINLNREKP